MYIHLFIYFRHFNIWQSIHKVLGSYMYTLLCCCYHEIPQQKATLKNGFTLAYGSRETESRTAQKTWQHSVKQKSLFIYTQKAAWENKKQSEGVKPSEPTLSDVLPWASHYFLKVTYLWNSAIKETECSNVRVYWEQFLSVHPSVQYFKSWSRNCI